MNRTFYALTMVGWLTFTTVWTSSAATLPPELQSVRQQVIEVCRANTTRTDNIRQVRSQLDPLVDQLAQWFNANRPDNEVALTQRPWKSIWYDDPTIDEFSNASFGPISFSLDREQVYQVVEDGYYYNVSESTWRLFGIPFKVQNFLKGAYTVTRPASPANAGAARLNTVDLEFVFNAIKPGRLRDGIDLRRLVRGVNTRLVPTQRVPGPIGVTGELWNVYIDETLRISAGFEDVEPGTVDLYILLSAPKTGPLP